MNHTKKIINEFKREQSRLSARSDRISTEDITEFTQYKFNERYLLPMSILIIVTVIPLCIWTVYGNTFDSGLMRFLITFLSLHFFFVGIKGLLFSKIKDEFGLCTLNETEDKGW